MSEQSETEEAGSTVVARAPRRLRLGLGAAVVVGLVAVSVTVGIGLLGRSAVPEEVVVSPSPRTSGPGVSAGAVYAHVLGEVSKPGLYVLDDGARVAEALAAAGGTLPTADLAAVNLARTVADGEQILVPAIGAAGAAPGAAAGTSGAAGGGAAGGLVDLNTADVAALDQLPRIGPALAQRIVDWRTANGRFTSVDDLLGVSGIGEKMLAGIRDLVRV
ncbi:ComEA family DNA-binding protein [Microbacterium sp. MYb64]|uniref:ComEA family DNA-binding protein n=1 Tax=Microbacterium sp. MYb64 TaxID=1848691 RepID=UPI000CFCF3A5|nr:ComEA family DNA-binding protein [Microbacterium sp. MYb64]PRB08060.1 competence protein ComEA [Microbacterium sp. MYb64]